MIRLLVAPAMALALLVQGLVAAADGEITGVQVTNGFPDTLSFKATVSSDAGLSRVELHYTVLPDGTDAIGHPTFSPGKTATVEFTLKVNDPPRAYFPAGTTFRYHWEIEDAAGTVTRSEPREYLFLDNRFEWKTAAAGALTLYYHSGSSSYAEELARGGEESLLTIGELLGVTVPFPVRVFLYSDPGEMEPALQKRSERYSELVITGGVRVASDLVFVAKGFADTEATLRHELAHVVTKVAGTGPFGDLPAWLDEGVAVYAQGEPGSGYAGAIEDGLRRDNLLSLRSMGVQTAEPGKVNLFYGQSWSLVSHLVDTYGQAKFAELFAEFKKGATTDDALLAVYSLNTEGLEDAWREAHGLPPRSALTPTATPSPPGATPVATLTPFTGSPTAPPAATQAPTTPTPPPEDPSTGASASDGAPVLVIALAAVGLGLVVLLSISFLALRASGRDRRP